MESVKERLESANQEHVLKFFDELTENQQFALVEEIKEINWEEICHTFEQEVRGSLGTSDAKLKPTSKIDDDLLNPIPEDCIAGTTRCNAEAIDAYQTEAIKRISEGKIAALLLAGGQGTRLGVSYPKGMYDVGLPSKKSLFQLQAERILALRKLAKSKTGLESKILWYIMTSEATMETTRDFFDKNNYFGLDKSDIIFFEQFSIPCFDFQGRVLLDQKYKVSRSPNGNGGLYEALHKRGILDHMISNKVEFLHAYCVDNILVRVCDPSFMGYCIKKGVDVGAKVVEKVLPTESVGTICKVGESFKVIEYSEISDKIAQMRNESNGKLVFNAGNICEHFFRTEFLKSITGSRQLRYHIALKKIPHICLDTGDRIKPNEPNGIKLERFIFDVFEFSDKFAAWEVKREDEFSPLKNADGTEKDNPTSCLKALQRSYELGILDV